MTRNCPVTSAADVAHAHFGAHSQGLVELQRQSRLRKLAPRRGLDFSSNDYLGLAQSPELKVAVVDALSRGVPIGSGGSRLLRGNHEEHELLEEEAAKFIGSQASLFFSTGFAANSALFSTLPQRGDLIVHDELIHASAHEGIKLSRADSQAFRHSNMDALGNVICSWRQSGGRGRVWIAAESLYSMDGDVAPLASLMAIANAHDAILVIDEAHATGVLGQGGRGLAAELQGAENLITVHTCGKALGCEGALVCCPRIVRDFLVNRGRAFIFSTAPSPIMAAAVRASLKLIATDVDRIGKLHDLIATSGQVLAAKGVLATGSQIMPLIVGDDAKTMAAANALQLSGFDVRGIRPPTVPPGTSRLRISITLNITATDVVSLASALDDVFA